MTQSKEHGSHFRILLVEDHRDTRNALERLLRRHQHEVWSASNASAALELAARHKLDLVISDLGLPDVSGMELMRRLRDQYGLEGIAVSGYGMDDDIVGSRAAGFVHHLTKPISLERLHEMIANIGERHVV